MNERTVIVGNNSTTTELQNIIIKMILESNNKIK